ncbi:MAG TPA: hypothetical protein VKA95_05455 [Nitrososphaeraceae archaeon]|nr:hypothetical protein [Nitrososphaeraceae archaeon]
MPENQLKEFFLSKQTCTFLAAAGVTIAGALLFCALLSLLYYRYQSSTANKENSA